MSGQDSGLGKHGYSPHTTTSKLLLNIEQPSLRTVRNRVEWKSDNYQIQETIFTQTCLLYTSDAADERK